MSNYDLNDLFDANSSVSLGAPTFTTPPAAQNTFADGLSPTALAAGELQGNMQVQDGYLQSSNYVANSTGWRLSPTSADINGGVSVDSLDIPDIVTANSFHTDMNGNSWWGSTLLANSLASVTAAGLATFAGISTLNKKAYTNFETAARFVASVGGSGSNSFGNQGVTIAPGITSSSYSKLLWDIANVFTNNPTFTATVNVLSVNSGDARCFIGLGQPTVSGTGVTYAGASYIGFSLNKTSGVLTLSSEMGNGIGNVGASITTLVLSDIVELFIKVTATSVKWYYRRNGGTLTLGDTQTTNIPTGSGESSIMFTTSNAATVNNIQLILQCAAYEH